MASAGLRMTASIRKKLFSKTGSDFFIPLKGIMRDGEATEGFQRAHRRSAESPDT